MVSWFIRESSAKRYLNRFTRFLHGWPLCPPYVCHNRLRLTLTLTLCPPYLRHNRLRLWLTLTLTPLPTIRVSQQATCVTIGCV